MTEEESVEDVIKNSNSETENIVECKLIGEIEES